jgi:hypothetical protein
MNIMDSICTSYLIHIGLQDVIATIKSTIVQRATAQLSG